ncbi:hypothetical protein SAMN05443144_13111 [Fodinibius roseus]|uniref:HEAT repeat-containing protein n=1 Tax=Fodinibius roseus TaxID=1194090 RepID=A0A1M5KE03_9BACT|nr:hypothetical protein [Fodinibius roseus]SHG50840.1 hypothetical protein SAMN05443144_13111 [Fodinibius roseus]
MMLSYFHSRIQSQFYYYFLLRAAICLFVVLIMAGGHPGFAQTGAELPAGDIARQLLDEDVAEEERRTLAGEQADRAAEVLRALTRDLESGTDEEARRIPWIWRVSIKATGRNDAEQIRRLAEVGLPEMDEPLLNWQVVVLGGGIVNGLSREGHWPRPRIREILAGHPQLESRWQQAVERSYEVAEDPDLPYPWRYDALRLIAMDEGEQSIPELRSYLKRDLDYHLHMGAISGLSDIRSPKVPELLLSGWSHYNEQNRNLVLDGLLRTERRTRALLDAIEEGPLRADELGEEQLEQLKNHENPDLRKRAKQLLSI